MSCTGNPAPLRREKVNSYCRNLAVAGLIAFASLTGNSAIAETSGCQALLQQRDVNIAQTVCRQELAARQDAARDGKTAELESLAKAHDNLGRFFMLARQYQEAEAQYRASLTVRQKAFGNEHYMQASSLLPLADALIAQNKIAEADSLLSRALALREKGLGARSEATAQAHHALGMLYARTDASKAERSFRDEIAILEQLYPQGSAATAIAYNNLGILHQRAGQPDQAESYYRSAITMLERTAPDDKIKLDGPLISLATLLTEKQQYGAAKSLLLQLLNIRSQLHGPNSAEVADIHNRLGVLHSRIGALDLAEADLRKALTMRENTLGTNHLLVAESCTNLGIFLMHRGRLNEALTLLRHSAALIHTQTGPQSAQTSTAWTNLEQLYGRIVQETMAGN